MTSPSTSSAASWPPSLSAHFRAIPRQPSERDFYGAYNKVLCTLFPVDSPFTVTPYPRPHPAMEFPIAGAPLELVTDFLVFVGIPPTLHERDLGMKEAHRPVLALKIHDPARLPKWAARQRADEVMRKLLVELSAECPIDVVRGISAFGTKVCLYALDKSIRTSEGEQVGADIGEAREIEAGYARRRDVLGPADVLPMRQPDLERPGAVADLAPMERWDCDLLSEEGAQRLRDVVDDIKSACDKIETM